MYTQRPSESTKTNYDGHIAQIAFFYCFPTIFADDQIEDYLEGVILKGSANECYF
jgi:hypothetical protein